MAQTTPAWCLDTLQNSSHKSFVVLRCGAATPGLTRLALRARDSSRRFGPRAKSWVRGFRGCPHEFLGPSNVSTGVSLSLCRETFLAPETDSARVGGPAHARNASRGVPTRQRRVSGPHRQPKKDLWEDSWRVSRREAGVSAPLLVDKLPKH